MSKITGAIFKLFRDSGDREVAYFTNLASQIVSGKSKSPVSDMVRLVGFPYQLVYQSQEVRHDN